MFSKECQTSVLKKQVQTELKLLVKDDKET